YEQQLRQEAYKGFPEQAQLAIAKPQASRTAGEQLLAQQVIEGVTISGRAIDRVMSPADGVRKKALADQMAALENERPKPIPVADIVTDGDYRAAPDGEGDEVVGCPKCRIWDTPTGSFLHAGPGRYEAP